MARGAQQKRKLLVLQKILLERTDENHGLTVAGLIDLLAAEGIPAERKSIYDDLETLRLHGMDIELHRGKHSEYYVANRLFELPELKLLVDAVQASKFITHRKSAELIKKVESLASNYEAQLLQRQVYVAGRIKTMNESIYYNVDKIHTAITFGKKISYRYFEWTVSKEKKPRHGGKRYRISPWALTWEDENYYMIGYDSDAGLIKHYRVDKMMGIEMLNEPRDGQEHFEAFDMAAYTRKLFGMFSGEEETVKLRFSNRLAGVVIDRFGQEVPMVHSGPDHFVATVKVALSPQFLSWVFGFGGDVKILSPESVVEMFKAQARGVLEQYENTSGRRKKTAEG